MVIVEVVADLGIPERTPVAELRANPEGRGVTVVKVEGASVVMENVKATPAVAETAALEVKAGPDAWTVTVRLPVAVFAVSELDAVNVKVEEPLMPAPGERVIMPVAALIEAQLGFEVSA
jgi:hypothetical protein